MNLIRKLIVIPLLVLIIGCSRGENHNGSASQETQASGISGNKEKPRLTAAQIIDTLKSNGLPISSVVFFTDENDPNKLLGRPGQYIEKAKWADKRVEQTPDYNPAHKGMKEDMDPEGGGIEVFNSIEELERRKNYLEQPLPIGPPLVEYRYVVGTALVRLDKELTPKQALEYESVINKIKEQIQ